MYLKLLKIRKFRSIDSLDVEFKKGVNIIIGENSSGKSAVIDALRICLNYGKLWRDISIRNDEDFFIDSSQVLDNFDPIEFHLHFSIESDVDRQLCTSMLWQDPANLANQEIQMHFRYFLESDLNGVKKLRWSIWGGGVENQAIDSNEAQLLYYTYLAPLRNAEQELRPYSKDNKITSLFRDLTSYTVEQAGGAVVNKTLDDAEKAALTAKLEAVIQDPDWTGLINTGKAHINEHLEQADIRGKQSSIHLRLIEYKYENIVKGILIQKPVYNQALLTGANAGKQKFFDVSQNGLGENNLIYSSAVLGDLKNRRKEQKEHYYSLLIEEPEAHLHPQRQNTFFNYLNELRDLDLQVFITSHSPTITAKSDLDNLIVLQRQPGVLSPFTLRKSPLSDKNKSYLTRFLDVTKSQLFFSNGTILVEGISEALLLPVFALMLDRNYDLDKNGIEIVNTGGIAFEPFARLYNDADAGRRLPSRCSIITDDDRGIVNSKNFENIQHGITEPIAKQILADLRNSGVVDRSNRIITENGYAFNLGVNHVFAGEVDAVLDSKRNLLSSRAANTSVLQANNLRVKMAEYTFEYELMTASEVNYRIMMIVYKDMHPQTSFLPKTDPIKSRALEFVNKLDANKDKSVFSQGLAEFLEKRVGRTNFVVPTYIHEGIRWVIEGI